MAQKTIDLVGKIGAVLVMVAGIVVWALTFIGQGRFWLFTYLCSQSGLVSWYCLTDSPLLTSLLSGVIALFGLLLPLMIWAYITAFTASLLGRVFTGIKRKHQEESSEGWERKSTALGLVFFLLAVCWPITVSIALGVGITLIIASTLFDSVLNFASWCDKKFQSWL